MRLSGFKVDDGYPKKAFLGPHGLEASESTDTSLQLVDIRRSLSISKDGHHRRRRRTTDRSDKDIEEKDGP